MASNGYINEKTHNQFWREVNKLGTPEEMKFSVEIIKSSLMRASEYQKESWKSAKISSQNREVVRTQRLIELEKQFPEEYKKTVLDAFETGTFFSDKRDLQMAITSFEMQFEVTKKNTSKLLNAAAMGTSMRSEQGEQTQIIDIGIINASLRTISSSFDRVSKLLNPQWSAR